jgi:hypothetical protein
MEVPKYTIHLHEMNGVIKILKLFSKYNYNYQVKDGEMGKACSMKEGEEKCIQCFGGKDRRKETTRNS